MLKHAKLSASGSARWLNCTGSVKAEEPFKNKSSFAAMEGTCAHELADIVLTTRVNSQDFLGKTLEDAPTIKVDQEMIDHVDGYVEYAKALGGEQFYEVRLDFSHLVPDGFGTSDAIAINGDTLHVLDLKYGRGIVEAEKNSQAMLYALGAVEEYGFLFDIKNIVLHIYQPRVHNFSSWELTIEELLTFGEYVKKQAKEAMSDNAPRTPSEKACQWCRAKATCPALQKHTVTVLGGDFDDLDGITPVNNLTDEQLTFALTNKKLIESWLAAVQEHVSEKLTSGHKVKGFKLVSGRSTRKWANSDQAQEELIAILKDEAFEKKLITPAKAEKALGAKRKHEMEHLITKAPGKPTLAPENDKRKELTKNIDDFEIIA